MNHNFEEIKKEYNRLRNIERQKIVKELEKRHFKAKGHQGTWRYKSRGEITPPYDLGMWKWIVAKRDGITAVISFQVIEQDFKTKNLHALIDRISVDVFKDTGGNILSETNDSYFQSIRSRYHVENEFDSGFVTKTITDLELPLKEGDLEKLINIIEEKIEKLN